MEIIETELELTILASNIATDQMVLDVVCLDADKHCMNNSPSLVFFYFLSSESTWCVPINHNEGNPISNIFQKIGSLLKSTKQRKFVFDKKGLVQIFESDYNFIDLKILKYLGTGAVSDLEYVTNSHSFIYRNFRNVLDTNSCLPIYKHGKVFMEKVKKILPIDIVLSKEGGFKFVNDVMVNRFAELESNGMFVNDDFTEEFGNEQTKHIKNGMVYTQYNLLTSTGRPSNRFAGINYAALNKNDGSRKCFVSRYGDDGMLVMMDYNAFHPRLIAHLVNFHMESNENPYAYLSKYYFNKNDVNEEDIAVAKGFTFTQIYGGFDKKWLHIPYFSKIQDYIDHRWKFFLENGYIETPKYKRKIKECHIPDPNPSKLFNYILQAFETEMAVDVLGDILTYLNTKKSKPILYTYDSILFDIHKEDKLDSIKKIKNIMEQDKFPVKLYVGKNYGDMQHISI